MTPPRVDSDGHEIFLGRQSIVDREQNLRAFELLFRSSRRNQADVGSATVATATVINYALNELGLESLLGNYRGFINLDAEMLMSDTIELLPRDKVVLEVLETVEPTPAIVERCRQLRESGFTLAMDDFVRHEKALLPLLELTHIVKVDIQMLDHQELAKITRTLRSHNVQLLAEKVNDIQQFKYCMDLGFDLFQGYYFARPEIITGKRLSSSEMVLMRLLGMLIADADTATIENVFKQDPGLSVNMLRLVNSVATGASGKVTSLASALLVLGRRQVQRWLQLLLFARLPPTKDFPSPLLQLAAVRGKFLELLAAGDKAFEDNAFMAGIMSLMDVLLGMPLAEIVNGLPVASEVRDALLDRSGTLGRMLNLAEALERNEAADVSAAVAALPGYTASRVNSAQMEALRWANSIAQPGD
ncbi:MAG: EAL domain-containing protein [Burkholderiales bacterium]